jgi:asparagine synthase (glutamine-hydrolysing)
MSVQFGRWNFEGQHPETNYIEKVSATLVPFGPDSNESYAQGGVKILYRAFHTTKESHWEAQPHISPSGGIITWDGRLDNRAELIGNLGDDVTTKSTDVAIVATAYEKWDIHCFAKLVGDWALSIWNPHDRLLILAKDPIGARHLYYSIDTDGITWSTTLDPIVLFAGKTLAICEEYIAGWLSYFPATHLTPYVGIHSVPPSCSVLLRPGKHAVSKYWDFDPGKRIRHRTDAEYEEHFRTVLTSAVQRRLRSDRPVLAELSGGMDSSSIVCTADTVIANGQAECPRLDTISWYDDSHDHVDPDWNELPYFTRVEERRGRTGSHLNTAPLTGGDSDSERPFVHEFANNGFAATPNSSGHLNKLFTRYAAYLTCQGYRTTLSGIGGDEATGGGMPTPRPELQNLLARGQFFSLARQLKAWSVKMKKPQIPLLWEAIREFLPLALTGVSRDTPIPPPWLHPDFIRRNRAASYAYPFAVKLFGPLPSFQNDVINLEINRRLLESIPLRSDMLCDRRFPYLDRDLLEFAYSIPREQIVRVGQRRSLMKRALVGIVPDELLNRKRKAPVPPKPHRVSSTQWPSLPEIGQDIVSACIGITHRDRFLEALQKARCNKGGELSCLRSTVTIEFWLRHLTTLGVVMSTIEAKQIIPLTLRRTNSEHFALPKSSAS